MAGCVRCLPMKLLQLPKVHVYVGQSCLTLQDPVDCRLPGSSAHGGFPGKKAISSSRGSSCGRTELESWVSCIGRWNLYPWATWEALLNDTSPCSTTQIEVDRRPGRKVGRWINNPPHAFWVTDEGLQVKVPNPLYLLQNCTEMHVCELISSGIGALCKYSQSGSGGDVDYQWQEISGDSERETT